MDLQALQFIRDALPGGRTLFHYFPDRYAQFILQQLLGDGELSVAELKRSRYAPLLEKSCIKQLLASLGRPTLTVDDLHLAWPGQSQAFRLSLGAWPGEDERPRPRWNQLSRWGWNLVLQLNVVQSHRRTLAREVPYWESYTNTWHPIAQGGELTLAWSRLDIDLESGEALIEEIQSDWVRDVRDYASPASYYGNVENWRAYRDAELRPLERRWPETMLTAALWFLMEELGIERVFYHTFQSGIRLKGIGGTAPPRSLYTELPRKFCFRQTHNGPAFLRDSKDRGLKRLFTDPQTRWFVQDFRL